jgi:hypothetical protein
LKYLYFWASSAAYSHIRSILLRYTHSFCRSTDVNHHACTLPERKYALEIYIHILTFLKRSIYRNISDFDDEDEEHG